MRATLWEVDKVCDRPEIRLKTLTFAPDCVKIPYTSPPLDSL